MALNNNNKQATISSVPSLVVMASLRTRPLVTARWVYKQLAAETAQHRINETAFLNVLDATHGPNTDPGSFVK